MTVNNTTGWASLLFVIGLMGCTSESGPRTASPVILESETQVKVDEQGDSQVSGASAPQAPAGEAK